VWDEKLQGVVGMIVAFAGPDSAKAAFAIPSTVLVAVWPPPLPLDPRNPYKGLHAFTEHDTRDFFGRESRIDELVEAIKDTLTCEQQGAQPARLLTVFGPSGSGKSSVVMAGLLPRLRGGKVLNSKEWVYLDPIVPGKDPLEALTVALKPHSPDTSFKTLREDLKDDAHKGLHLLARELARKRGSKVVLKVVLLVDQFEEVFTQTTDDEERQRFFELLIAAVTEPGGPLFVILTLRADFYDRLMSYPKVYRLIDDHHVAVLPLEEENLRRVIEQPANLLEVQLTFERGLVDELLFAIRGQSGALPLLEFTLDQLVQRRNGHQLTLQAYHEMGGVEGALSQHVEQTYQNLPSDEHRQMARDVFLRLIEPGTTEQETTRRRAMRSEFEQANPPMQTQSMQENLNAFLKACLPRTSKQETLLGRATHSQFKRTNPMQAQHMEETLDAFIRARLLTTNQNNSRTTIEVSHEVLIREWRRLTEWLREFREDILFQQSLSEDVIGWEQRRRPKDRLYRGVQLKEAQIWAKRNRPSKQEAAFLQASERQRKLNLVGLIAVVLLVFSLAGAALWFVITRPPSPTLVTTLQDNVNGSLRYCINNAPSGSTITFAQGLHGPIKLVGSLVFISGRQLTLRGPGADQITISGGNTDSSIRVSRGAKVSISGLSFKNSEMVTDAFLFNEGTLTVTSSIISNNKTTTTGLISYGGGIENRGILTVSSSTFSNNSSIGDAGLGGGIYNDAAGTLTVNKSTFLGNTARGSVNPQSLGYGGSICNSGKLTVTDSTFSNNTASSTGSQAEGGGIFNDSAGSVMVTSSTFSGNVASGEQDNGRGGGIDNEGTLTVTNTTFSHNAASSRASDALGGGIVNASASTLMVSNSTFSGNSASGKQNGQGGGIDNTGKLTVLASSFSHNAASGDTGLGGGIDNTSDGTLMVSNSTFSGNSAGGKPYGQGGGIDNAGKLAMLTSTVLNNVASGSSSSGGGILSSVEGSSAIIRFCTIYGNTANAGGGIWVDPTGSGHMTVSSSIVAANSAQDGPDISGILNSDGYNLIGNFVGGEVLNASTDKQVQLADLKIDTTLRNDGGPTQTLALLQGSSAIDAVPLQACSITVTDVVSGKSVTISTDQRGMPRPDGSENACDAGAYESSY
jgi:energy-coupling factor transporter ATP-binding protein EcfA2